MGLIITLGVGGVILSKLALRKLDARLHAAGIKIRSLNVNLFARSVTIEGFEWRTPAPDSLSASANSSLPDSSFNARGQVAANIKTIHAAGIDVMAFIRKKEIHLGSLVVSEGKVVIEISNHSRQQGYSRNDHKIPNELPFTQVTVGDLQITDLEIVVNNDSIIEHMGHVSLAFHDVGLSQADHFADPQAYTLGDFKATVGNYRMATQKSMYTLKVKRIAIDSRSKEMIVDSVVLLPRYGKYQFSRRVGKQVDRFVLRVPQVTLAGLDFSRLRDSLVVASSLKIDHANLYVFRDKRLPFTKRSHMPLPVALIRTLRIGFALDSLILADTKITYEEFPEKGFETGYIVFDHLQASVAQVSNRDLYPGLKQSVLHVTSRVMKNGVITVDFTLPYDKAQVYNAKGRISNLGLQQLNPMLESLAFIRVESGRLNALDFNFDYDDYTSRGNILINYENLKLAGLKKDKGSQENDIKSLALGLFVRKDKDRAVPLENRTGKVYYERDRRRAIFNVWVKSLFSGVKSSVVDPPSERKPQTRKQRRDSLRDVRKETREKKKRERQDQKNEKQTEKRDTVRSISSVYGEGFLRL